MDAHEVSRLIATIPHWHHQIELAPGIITPGSYDPRFLIDKLSLPSVLSGVRVLDIGPSDGYFSMQLALRGAEVTAIDYRAKGAHGFGIMELVTGLSFDYRQMNVYDVPSASLGTFNIILFLGVLYHLPDMIRALDAISELLAADGKIFIETEHEPDWCPGMAAARYYESASLAGDYTNFWAPDRECVVAMLRDCSITPEEHHAWGRRLLINGRRRASGRTAKMTTAYGLP